jgi:phosphate transport system protein
VTMSDHTAKAFDLDLQELRKMIAEMGGLTERQIMESLGVLECHDAARARRVIAADLGIDALQREIEDKAVLTIARRQPMAVDLRELVGALRLCNDLERIGDLAKNIAKRAALLEGESHALRVSRGLQHMGAVVLAQLKQVLDSFATHDLEKALAVWRDDEEIDALCISIFRELLTYMLEDPRNITSCIHLLFCAKNIERIGDHATNVAETVYYLVEGRTIPQTRPKGDDTVLAALSRQ